MLVAQTSSEIDRRCYKWVQPYAAYMIGVPWPATTDISVWGLTCEQELVDIVAVK